MLNRDFHSSLSNEISLKQKLKSVKMATAMNESESRTQVSNLDFKSNPHSMIQSKKQMSKQRFKSLNKNTSQHMLMDDLILSNIEYKKLD